MTASRIPAEGFTDAEFDAIPGHARLVREGLVNIAATSTSERKATLIGRRVAEVLYDGTRVVGTVESVDVTGTPIARLADGHTVRLGHLIDLVDEAETTAEGQAVEKVPGTELVDGDVVYVRGRWQTITDKRAEGPDHFRASFDGSDPRDNLNRAESLYDRHVHTAHPDDDAAELARPTSGGRRYVRGAVHYFPFDDSAVALCGINARGSIDTEAPLSCPSCTVPA